MCDTARMFFVDAVEAADAWKPEANLYDAGKDGAAARSAAPKPVGKSLSVGAVQNQRESWVSAQPVIEGSLGKSHRVWFPEAQSHGQTFGMTKTWTNAAEERRFCHRRVSSFDFFDAGK